MSISSAVTFKPGFPYILRLKRLPPFPRLSIFGDALIALSPNLPITTSKLGDPGIEFAVPPSSDIRASSEDPELETTRIPFPQFRIRG